MALSLATFVNLCGISAQTIDFDEMITLAKCTSHACFKSTVTTKGFSYSETTKEKEGGTTYCYTADKQAGSKIANEAKICLPDNKKYTTVLFFTSVKSTYKSLLAEFETNKFIADEETKKKNIVETVYYSKNYRGYGLHLYIIEPTKGRDYHVYCFKLGYVLR